MNDLFLCLNQDNDDDNLPKAPPLEDPPLPDCYEPNDQAHPKSNSLPY